ncbi:hypothetical protein DP107_06460 [Haloglomus irregulare]|uniref:Uncharacterized protein n=1 Tax=Haloglomus irregulare TaxID=2234134 RepID=A0A554NB54_9EURY|nr:hypothetical protein [Haloglomus irregulare]TSD14624.1 hypothetical protein DP107_06460 [Haloglomus irregulare]
MVAPAAGFGFSAPLPTVPPEGAADTAPPMLPRRYLSLGDACATALGSLAVIPWAALRPQLELIAVPERSPRCCSFERQPEK